MALATMIKELNAARKAYNDKLASLGDDTAKAIGEYLAPHIPEGFTVQWHQYTPYFNDGDATTFSVHEPYLVKLEPDADREVISRYAEDEETCLDLGSAIDYGEPDREVTEPNRWKPGEMYTYNRRGVPLIDGLPQDQFRALLAAWNELPEDMLEAAFGDHVRCRVYSDGTTVTNDHSHD